MALHDTPAPKAGQGARSGLGARALITIFEAAMAPQIGAAIVAVDHESNPALVTLMLGIGMPPSFLARRQGGRSSRSSPREDTRGCFGAQELPSASRYGVDAFYNGARLAGHKDTRT